MGECGPAARMIYAGTPPRVEYSLTETVLSLKPVVDARPSGKPYTRRESNMRTELTISKTKYFILILPTLIVLGIAIWLSHTVQPSGTYERGLLYLVIGVTGFAALMSLAGMIIPLRKIPLLVIDDNGLTIRSLLGSGQTLPWDCIAGASVKKVLALKLLALHLKEPEKYADMAHGYAKDNLTGLQFQLFSGLVSMMLSMPAGEVAALIAAQTGSKNEDN